MVWQLIKVIRYRHSLTAEFSDCGSFCLLTSDVFKVTILSSMLLKERQVKLQLPAVWGRRTSYNGQVLTLERNDNRSMIQLRQAIDLLHKNGFRDDCDVKRAPEYKIAVNIAPLPSHLVSAEFYLLVKEQSGDTVRILFLPNEGPPELKHLSVTMDQILAKLDEAAKAAARRIAELFAKESNETTQDESDG